MLGSSKFVRTNAVCVPHPCLFLIIWNISGVQPVSLDFSSTILFSMLTDPCYDRTILGINDVESDDVIKDSPVHRG